MNAPELLNELERMQRMVRALIEDSSDQDMRIQRHPDLSPLGWHLGHCVYIECYWLHEVVHGDATLSAPLAELYVPPRTPKPERGARLPQREQLLAWATERQDYNLHYLANLPKEHATHKLHAEHYLCLFLLQHYQQHYETMLMILQQGALGDVSTSAAETRPLQAETTKLQWATVPGGHYRIGGKTPWAYDNELPPQHAELGGFRIARHPVCNAQYLAFMQDDGYHRQDLWDEDGQTWLKQQEGIAAPLGWRKSGLEHWHGIGIRGPYTLAPGEPVMGINHHEARAFARWAGAQLPHEYQWEAACRLQLLEGSGRAWEWCANRFHPYAGYRAFPYDDYSKPWFETPHYTLKGGSLYTQGAIKRPSFRNFYEPDKRHIFAGLRLVR